MSDIKMCDSCGSVFSVNEDGWEEYTRKGSGNAFNNAHNHGAQTMHMGPCCRPQNGGSPVRPRIAGELEKGTETV